MDLWTRQTWITMACLLTLTQVTTLTSADSSPNEKLTTQDHMRAILEQKNAHSLWLILARGGIAKLTIDSQMRDVNIHTAKKLIQRWSQAPDYPSIVRQRLKSLGLPRNWNEENVQRVAAFKKEFPSAIVFETQFYHILSTADANTTKKLAKKMDAVFKLYERLFNFKEKIPYKCVIKFWKDQRQYLTKGAPSGTVAYYSPGTKELVGYNTKTMSNTKHMDSYESMYHEGWHQYFDFYIPNAPRWFDEGFAEFFSPAQIGRNRASMRRNTYRAKRAAFYLKKSQLIPLRTLFRMSHQEFMVNSDLTYSQSYSFISFMMNFHHGDKRLEHKIHSFYKDYFWKLREGVDPVQAVDDVFGHIKLEVLEEMWKKSVRRQR